LCPTAATPIALADSAGRLLDDLGAMALCCDPDTHDRAVAGTSCLPHVVSTALAAVVLSEPAHMVASLSGGGLRDTIRIAAADMDLWWDILRANWPKTNAGLRHFCTTIKALEQAISDDDRGAAELIWRRGQEAQETVMRLRWHERAFSHVSFRGMAGWGPLCELGADGRVLRKLRVVNASVTADAADG
jgi:prephenate dehydrogenase